jgi:hypothetical protein
MFKKETNLFRKPFLRIFPLLLLIAALLLTGCGAQPQPVVTSESAPTPVAPGGDDSAENPNIFVDPAILQAALLQALAAGDTDKLEMWMTDPVLTGWWRGELTDNAPAEAVKMLSEQLSPQSQVTLVENADLQALLGGKDPLSIPRQEVGVTDAFLVSGWGKDGLDEAILFISRGADDRVQWHGWMVIPGGFSGARLGGLQPYTDEANGYSLFLPKDVSVTVQSPTQVAIFPQGEAGHPGGSWIAVEPANGRTVEQIVEAVKAELPDFEFPPDTVLGIEDTQALVVSGLPGQDSTRQLFMVRDDVLYHFTFTPDDPELGEPYRQMEDLYAMIVNTFHFLPE